MDKPLTHSLPVKVTALFLFVILTFCMLFSGLVVIIALNNGIYAGVSNYYESDDCYREVMSDLHRLQNNLENGNTQLPGYFSDLESCNLRFAGYDTKTQAWISNDAKLKQALQQMLTEKNYIVVETDTDHQFETAYTESVRIDKSAVEFSEDGLFFPQLFEQEINEVLFLAGVVDPMPAYDAYFRQWQSFHVIYRLEGIAPIVLIAGIFLLAADVIYLCCASGHRYGKDRVVLNMQDRLPLDLYLFAMFWPFMLGVVALSDLIYHFNQFDTALMICFIGTVLLTLALALLLTLSTRIKVGKWWRNTLIYLVWRLCWKTCKGIWCSIKVGWRVALLCLLLFLIIPMTTRSIFYPLLAALLTLMACWILRQMLQLREAGAALAIGSFDQVVDTATLHGALREHGEDLNSLGQGLSIAVDQRMRSERLKTELITNVSHDIKTPLTSIINYVDLLQKDPTPKEQAEYLAVLDRQAKRLKKLTEDLVEASKASTGNLTCNLAPTCLREMLEQALGEYEDRLQQAGLEVILTLSDEDLAVWADGRLLWRVLDNLLNNACKYAQTGTRLYVDANAQDQLAYISLKNISRQQLNLSPDELMERFVRGDSSRNTEGSGLGLNIAKSLVELQKGTFHLSIDGDLFKASIVLPKSDLDILS